MSKNLIPTLCYYDGELIVDEQSTGKYVGGICKPGRVRKGCSLAELKESVYKTTKINSTEFDIDLVVKWPTDSGSTAIKLSDDEDVECLFLAVTKSIELYVGKVAKEIVASPAVSTGIGYFTQMMENDNPSAGLLSPTYSNPTVNAGSYGSPPLYYGFMPTMMPQARPEQYFPYYTPPLVPMMTQM